MLEGAQIKKQENTHGHDRAMPERNTVSTSDLRRHKRLYNCIMARSPFNTSSSARPPKAAQACCCEDNDKTFVLRTPAEFDEAARYNIFRDSPLRYMGYCNEIGESFRYQFPRLVVPSYILSFGYVGADALTTGYREYCSEDTSSSKDSKASSSREYRAGIATFDTLLWQSLASVMIPGLAINLVVKASRFAVARSPVSLPVFASKWLPTASGIGSIPLIIHPIDSFVDFTLDNSTREWLDQNTSDDETNNEGSGQSV